MEPQNSSAKSSTHGQTHPLLPNNFGNNTQSFPMQFATATAAVSNNDNVSSPLFMQTLQQLSGLSGATAGMLPTAVTANTNFSNVNTHFSPTDFTNWNSQPTWFDQAKMAAMLPVYLKTATSGSTDQNFQLQNNVSSIVEQNLKNQAVAAVAAAAVSGFQTNNCSQTLPNYNNIPGCDKVHHAPSTPTGLNFQQQLNSIPKNNNKESNAFEMGVTHQKMQTEITSPQQQHLQHQATQLQHYKTSSLPQQKFTSLQHTVKIAANPPHGLAPSPLSNSSPSIGSSLRESPLNSRVIHSHTSYPSSSSSHPPSNEGMIESPLSSYGNIHIAQHQNQHQQSRELDINASSYQYMYMHQNNIQQQNKQNHSSSSHIVMNNNCKQQPSVSSSNHLYSETEIIKNSAPTSIQNIPLTQHREEHYSMQHMACKETQSSLNLPHGQNAAQQQELQKSRYQQQQCHTSASPSTSHNINSDSDANIVEHIDDLSTMLDLHEFEDLLNDKDALAAALNTDPSSLLNDTGGSLSLSNAAATIPTTSHVSLSEVVRDKTPPASSRKTNIQPPSASIITSAKMRERIHERRAEELANADKELDRLVSLVARQNDAKNNKAGHFSLLNLDLLNSLKQPSLLKPTSLMEPTNSSEVQLNPVQFTPPDSPTNTDIPSLIPTTSTGVSSSFLTSTVSLLKGAQKQECDSDTVCKIGGIDSTSSIATKRKQITSSSLTSAVNSGQPSTLQSLIKHNFKPAAAQPLMFIPKINSNTSAVSALSKTHNSTKRNEINGIKYNRVPVYKQRLQNSSFSSRILNPPLQEKNQNLFVVSRLGVSRSDSTNDLKSKSDAYNFTDDEDEEEESALPKIVSESIASTSNNANLIRSTKTSKNVEIPISQTTKIVETAMASRSRRRQILVNADRSNNHFVAVAPAGASTKTISAAPPLAQLVGFLDALKRRRDERLNYLKTVDCTNEPDAVKDANAAFSPESDEDDRQQVGSRCCPTMTCMLKIDQSDPCSSASVDNGEHLSKALPKLVIKFVKPDPIECDTFDDEEMFKSKKKKKHKKRDRDYEWRESSADSRDGNGKRHHRHKKEKRHKRRRSLNLGGESAMDVSPGSSITMRNMSIDQGELATPTFLMNDFSRSHETLTSHTKLLSNCHDSSHDSKTLDEADREFINVRLQCFSRANGALPKGTFLVAKDDVFKTECPLWKIDNQNLLQKYPQLAVERDTNNGVRYRNSSTYSGWCDRIADDYLVVEVKFVKQSRAENIIEPLVPVRDLFPIIVSELEGNLMALREDENSIESVDSLSVDSVENSRLNRHLNTLVKALLKHVITLTFLQTIRSAHNLNYLESLDEVEQRIKDTRETLLRRVKWTKKFVDALDTYSNISFVDLERPAELCQACKSCEPSTSIHLFGPHEELLLLENVDLQVVNEAMRNSCIAIEFFLCGNCENVASLYHQNTHLKMDLFKKCEEKLEEIAFQTDARSPDALVERCLQDKKWTNNIIIKHIDLWRRCDSLSLPYQSLPLDSENV